MNWLDNIRNILTENIAWFIVVITLAIIVLVAIGKKKRNNYKIILWFKYTTIVITTSSLVYTLLCENIENIMNGVVVTCYFALVGIIAELYGKSKYVYTFKTEFERLQKEYDDCTNIKGVPNNTLIEKYVSSSLYYIIENISSLHPIFLCDNSHYYEEKLKDFITQNAINSKNYLLLCCNRNKLYNNIFSTIYYNIFSKINNDFLFPLLPAADIGKHNLKVPEFLSNEISKTLICCNGFSYQHNTCIQGMKDFLDNISEPIKDSQKDRMCRLFIYETGPTNKLIKDYDKDSFNKVVKWHEDNNWKIKFIENTQIPNYSHNIQSIDFSVIKINDEKCVLRITSDPIKENFYTQEMNFYLIEIVHSKDDVTLYDKLFNDLWKTAQDGTDISQLVP